MPVMFKKTVEFLVPKFSGLRHRTVFLIFFLVTFFIRLPFFFRDYVDRDESTFILMGQSWADGHLPYTELWDLKPPITFLFFAAIIYSFGKSFFIIRLFGAFIVAITAFLSYRIGALVESKRTGYWAGLFCIFLLSLFGSLQGVMSEHICMVFFMSGLYLILNKEGLITFFLAGLFFGLSVMSKLNIAYTILFLGIYLFANYLRSSELKKGLGLLLVMGIGIIGIILLTILPYYINGMTEVWWNSVVVASLEYSGEMQSSILKTLPFCIIVFLLLLWGKNKNLLDFDNRKIRILFVTVLSILLMFILGGKINGHYLIQFHPVFIILFVLIIGQFSIFRKSRIFGYLPLLLFLIPMESYKEYYDVFKHKASRGTFYNGEGITVPNYLKEHQLDEREVLFFEYHIGYWPLNKKPPTKAATHPSNILREAIFPIIGNPRKTGFEELQFIMENIQPEIVVTRSGRSIFDETKPLENLYAHTFLAANYELIKTLDQANIYRRLERQ